MTPDDINNRFNFHPADTDAKRLAHEAVRGHSRWLAHWLNEALPDGREKSIAMTKLEEVMFWSNAAVARESGKDSW